MKLNLSMKKIAAITGIGFMAATGINSASAQTVFSTGFEGGIDNSWTQVEPVFNSGVAFQGSGSAQVDSGGRLFRTVDIQQNTEYTITAYVRGGGRLRARWDGQNLSTRVTSPSNNYIERSITINSGSASSLELSLEFESEVGRFDTVSVVATGGGGGGGNSGGFDFGLNPNNEPWENFDLTDWALDAPNPDPEDGLSARTSDIDFANGDLFPGSEPYFFTGSDGAMVFRSNVGGRRTSSNTSFPRSELREMLRRGNGDVSTQGVNENNWVLGYQPNNLDLGAHTTGAQENTPTRVGGREGVLTATMSVNRVTRTGSTSQVGRTIIGQIHADNDEPVRLYYRKLPNNELGSVYFTHEIRDDDDLDDVNLVGSSSSNASNPSDGIALGQIFSYEIINEGSEIEVILRDGDRDGPIIGRGSFDMDDENSGYDRDDEWMYFKAGAYTQNNTGNDSDFDEVAIYRLDNQH